VHTVCGDGSPVIVGAVQADEAVTVTVELFLYRQVVPAAVRFDGTKNMSTEVPAATATEPLKVAEMEEPLTLVAALPKVFVEPPLFEVYAVKVPEPELIVASHVRLESVNV
jgi:hypothetical protein